MDIEIREYRESDYSRCAALVGEAWQFDSVFKPAEFTELAKDLYTGGSLIESSFKSVAVSNGEVVGFLFGIHRVAPGTGLHLLFRLKMVWRFYRIRNASPNKNDLIKALSAHEKNRSPWVPRKRNEIALFVVAKPFKGRGVGTALWRAFLATCARAGETEIFVETNKAGASGFYEQLGFTHLTDFDSPLHRIATPDGVACLYVHDSAA